MNAVSSKRGRIGRFICRVRLESRGSKARPVHPVVSSGTRSRWSPGIDARGASHSNLLSCRAELLLRWSRNSRRGLSLIHGVIGCFRLFLCLRFLHVIVAIVLRLGLAAICGFGNRLIRGLYDRGGLRCILRRYLEFDT